MMWISSGRGVRAALGVACIVISFGANAQQTDSTQSPSRTASRGVEEITVTAEKTERSLQDTAIAIQAFDAHAIESLGLLRAEDVGKFTPGLVSLPGPVGGMATTYTGRGVGERDYIPGLPQSVGLYVDGLYIGTALGMNFALLDIERFEMLKGPQGTLFGRNTIGGAVSVTTVKPQPEFGGSATVGLGTYDERSFRGMLNVPLIEESLFARVSVLRSRRDPFWKNTFGSDDYNDLDEGAARVALRWLATDSLTIDWSFDRTSIDNHGAGTQFTQVDLQINFLSQLWGGPDLNQFIRRDAGDFGTNDPNFLEVDTWQNILTLTWDVTENTEVKSISGWRKWRETSNVDSDGTPVRLFRAGDAHFKERSFYQEIQATGSLFDNRLDYALGATWFEEESEMNHWQAYGEAIYQGPYEGIANQVTDTWGDNYSWGLYGQTTLHATDRLHLTAGLRYSRERKESIRGHCGIRVTGFIGTPPFIAFTYPDVSLPFDQCVAGGGAYSDLNGATPGVLSDRVFRSDNWSPLFRVAYDWTDELMTYASWTRGYRSGGFNMRYSSRVEGMAPYDDETVSQWEIGMKSRWFDDRLQLNGSAFYSEFTDMQLSSWVSSTTGNYTVRSNAGRARIRGWELEAIAVPAEGLTIRLSHGWTASDFAELKECAPLDTNVPCAVIDRASYYRVAVVPKRTYTGAISYMLPASDIGTLEIAVNFRKISPMGYLAEREQWHNTASRTYAVYGTRIALYDAFGMSGLTLSLTGSNVTDRSYVTNGIDFGSAGSAGFTEQIFGDPRHFVFEIGYEF